MAAIEQSGGRPLIADERFRAKIAEVEVELKALEMTQLRVVAAAAAERTRSNKPDPASSILKIKGSEIQQTITELLLEVVGPYALPDQTPHDESDRWNEPPVGPDWAGPLAPQYFNYAQDHRSTAARTKSRRTSSRKRYWDCEPGL